MGRALAMDETTRQAAQEYLAAKLTEEEQKYEAEQNLALATARSLMVWKHVKDTILTKCREWNAITQEETLTCKETMLGDLRGGWARPGITNTSRQEGTRCIVPLRKTFQSAEPRGRKYCVPLTGSWSLFRRSWRSSLRSTKSISDVLMTRRSEAA